jgi:large subunit ribosomal protein L13
MQLQRITTHTKQKDLNPTWHVIDAEGERLGRLASRVAALLQGKHRADYSRHQLTGDFVIVVNAAKVSVSGNKLTQKIYYRHTGYVGHLRSRSLAEMLETFPGRVIEMAVKGMLPRNRLGRQMLRRLKAYGGATHPHEAQVNAGQGPQKQKPAAAATRRAAPKAEVVADAAVEEEAVPAEAVAVPAATPAKAATATATKKKPAAKAKAPAAKAPAAKRALAKKPAAPKAAKK